MSRRQRIEHPGGPRPAVAQHAAGGVSTEVVALWNVMILGAFRKLYRSLDCEPGTAWATFTVERQPKHKYYGVIDEAEDYSPVAAMPGTNKLGPGATGAGSRPSAPSPAARSTPSC